MITLTESATDKVRELLDAVWDTSELVEVLRSVSG